MSSSDKILKAKALRQTAVLQLSLIIDAAVLAKNDDAALNPFKVRYRSLGKIIKDFEKHHNSLLALLAAKPDELKIEEKTGLDFSKRCHEIETIFYELFELPLEEHGVLDNSIHPSFSPHSRQHACAIMPFYQKYNYLLLKEMSLLFPHLTKLFLL